MENEKTPTLDEYNEAKKVVKLYEENLQKINKEKAIAIKAELDKFFADTDIKEIDVCATKSWIGNNEIHVLSLNPKYDEDYGGEFDSEMKRLSEKYNVRVRFEPDNLPK